jgi:hypothetical protein
MFADKEIGNVNEGGFSSLGLKIAIGDILLNFPERREATRFKGKLPIELEEGTGLTRDFSTLGVFFETDQSLAVGEPIKFVIPLDYSDWDYPFRICCEGEVLRVELTEGLKWLKNV